MVEIQEEISHCCVVIFKVKQWTFILFPARFRYNAALSRHLAALTCVPNLKDMVYTTARYASHFAGLWFWQAEFPSPSRTKYTQAIKTLVVQRCSCNLLYIVSAET
jgi:hypothetical protein